MDPFVYLVSDFVDDNYDLYNYSRVFDPNTRQAIFPGLIRGATRVPGNTRRSRSRSAQVPNLEIERLWEMAVENLDYQLLGFLLDREPRYVIQSIYQTSSPEMLRYLLLASTPDELDELVQGLDGTRGDLPLLRETILRYPELVDVLGARLPYAVAVFPEGYTSPQDIDSLVRYIDLVGRATGNTQPLLDNIRERVRRYREVELQSVLDAFGA